MSLPHNSNEVTAPVCYLHPGVVTYVSCQRCGRPICPDCQSPSAVGFICPKDAVKANNSIPKVRTIFGGVYRSDNTPVVTYTIIGLCIAVFIGEWIPQLNLVNKWVLVPAYVATEPWTLLTNIFLHSTSNILHIVLNMYMLWIMGQSLEPMLGRLRYAISYLVCGLGGSIGVVLFAAPNSQTWMIGTLGASGAIFGLFGMLLVLQRKLGIDIKQIAILILINLAFGFMVSGISWQAHLSGLTTGLILGVTMAYAPKAKQNFYQLGGIFLVTLLLIVAVFLKVNAAMMTGV